MAVSEGGSPSINDLKLSNSVLGEKSIFTEDLSKSESFYLSFAQLTHGKVHWDNLPGAPLTNPGYIFIYIQRYSCKRQM